VGGERFGVRGGLGPRQRAQLARRARLAATRPALDVLAGNVEREPVRVRIHRPYVVAL
jgi:hypothetical protein